MVLDSKIKNLLLIFLIVFGISKTLAQKNKQKLLIGADREEIYLPKMKGKRIAIITNHTGVRSDGQHIVDFLREKKMDIRFIFAPEHGFRGNADAGEKIKNGIDSKTGIQVISLYGSNKKPSPSQLKNIDLLVFDIQDVGVRFYTYISTLSLAMEAAAENNKEIMVLDRPNPHDGYIDGPILEQKFSSFVGMHPVPVVYGLTIGEYGNMVNGEKWLKNMAKARYTLIPMKNYNKKNRYSNYGKPSPNLPNNTAIQLYPSLCFFEGTEVSVGRGTPTPFQIYGSPWIKNHSFSFIPTPTDGAKKPFLEGKTCYGEDLTHVDKIFDKLELSWLISAYQNFDHSQNDFFLKNDFFEKLSGTESLRKQIIAGVSEEDIRKSWQKDLTNFEKIRKKYITYPD